ncbi:MAG: NAD-dependent succinate-semialdehyde dehydrogenase [Balneolaceae bacterium]|nr:NAD-dependent succinate-semialdehyde dehydrogenase [Balneolaceae bacterium]
MLQTINPATNELVGEYREHTFEEVELFIQEANIAQEQWKTTEFDHRASLLKELANQLEENKDALAELMADEMGKPLKQGVGEVEKCAWLCRYYADNAEDFLSNELVDTDAQKSYVAFEPLGVVLSIMPWNFPFWQVLRFGAPALMAGNGVILKHSENTTGCALAIEKMIQNAGYPKELFRTIVVDKENMKPIVQHDGIAAITLTGSTRAGKTVAAQAGEVLKKTVLELGGSDPYIILEDADLEHAANVCATSRLINSGQSCVAAKRFIVVDGVYDEFLKLFKEELKARKVGDPTKESTDIGPMAREDLRDELHRQVTESIEAGASAELGCTLPEGEGSFYPVSLLTNVNPGMPAYHEELFGPVAAVIKVADEEEAIRVANDTNYGLGAAVFSNNVDRAEVIAAKKLKAGCCFVNSLVKSDPRLPFGGIKDSGYGRELSLFGIREFVNVKTVWVE